MTSPRPVPIFDGHNDVLLRLYRRGGTDVSRAFLEGEAKGSWIFPWHVKEASLVGYSRSSSRRAMAKMALTVKQPLNASVVAPCRRQPSNWRRRKGLY